MRTRTAAVALLGAALLAPLPAAASPRGGDAPLQRFRRAAPVRVGRSAPAPRVSSPRVSTPRVSPPRVSTPRVSAPRVSAPRRAPSPRVAPPRAPRTRPTIHRSSGSRSAPDFGALRRGQGVPVRGQREAVPGFSGSRRTVPLVRSTSGDGSERRLPARLGGDRSAPRSDPAPAPRSVADGFRRGGLPSGTSPGRRADGEGARVSRDLRTGSGTSPARSIRSGVPGFRRDGETSPSTGSRPGAFGTRSRDDGSVRRGGTSPAPSPGATSGGSASASGSGLAVSGTAGSKAGATGFGYGHSGTEAWRRSGRYRDGFRNGYRVGYSDGYHDGRHDRFRYHDWYDHHRFHLSFLFSVGPYFGLSYYWPYHHWYSGIDFAFFYPAPVSYCYVPFGFYYDYTPVYVTRSVYVREVVPVTEYVVRETVSVEEAEAAGEAGPVPGAPDEELETLEPTPAASSPATEKFLREASELFREREYYEAAVKFRLAALSAPDNPAPLFALGQALLAMGEDEYAARVLRKAVVANPVLLREPADISGVYASPEEFDRVMAELEERAAASPVDGDARFLLGFQRYFIGDPRARETFDLLHEAVPEDEAVSAFRDAVEKRFKKADELLPPLVK